MASGTAHETANVTTTSKSKPVSATSKSKSVTATSKSSLKAKKNKTRDRSKNPKAGSGEQKEPSADKLQAKARVRTSKALTILFNKLQHKISVLEPLTPTWKWVCNVDKSTTNARFGITVILQLNKYKSPDKLHDLTRKVATNRISRTWGECIEIAKKIELLDTGFSVTVEAIKPEMESNARHR